LRRDPQPNPDAGAGRSFGTRRHFVERLVSDEYPARLAEVRVTASPDVIEAMDGVTAVFRAIGDETARAGPTPSRRETFSAAYRPRRNELLSARHQAVEAMRRDLQRPD
jgi:hypothetical protein